jgi:hypothetical protein
MDATDPDTKLAEKQQEEDNTFIQKVQHDFKTFGCAFVSTRGHYASDHHVERERVRITFGANGLPRGRLGDEELQVVYPPAIPSDC